MRGLERAARRPVIAAGAALAVLLAVGAALRGFGLDRTPAGLFVDEVAIATNALAIGRTGRDLAGERFPLYSRLRSFEAWGSHGIVSQPLFQYASVPFVTLLGLSEVTARLPAVVFGVLGIAATCLLGTSLFGRGVGLVAAGLLTVAPWHLHFSRVGFEAISLPATLAAGTGLLIAGSRRPAMLAPGALLMALATYAYPVAQLYVPLLLLAYGLCFRRSLLAHRRSALLAVALLALAALPNLAALAGGATRGRLSQTLIFAADLQGEQAVASLRQSAAEGGEWAERVLADRRLLVPGVFLYDYARYLSPSYLFLRGDANPRHKPTRLGMCHLFYAPLLLLGLLELLRRRADPHARFLLCWLLTWPIPGSLTVEAPHAIRSINALPALEICAALGLVGLARAARRAPVGAATPLRRGAARGLLALVLAGIAIEPPLFLRYYHGEYRLRSAPWWHAGIGPALREARARRPDYDRVLVSASLFNAYAFLRFYAGVEPDSPIPDPALGPRSAEPGSGFRVVFADDPIPTGRRDLWVLRPGDLRGARWKQIARFDLPDGRPAVYLAEFAGPIDGPSGEPGPEPAGPRRGARARGAADARASASAARRSRPPGGPA